MSTNNQLKIKIAQFRKKLNLTQLEVAQKVGVRETTIANWENGRSSVEWLVRLAKLCECLNCNPQDLFEYVSFEPEKELLDKFQGKGKNFKNEKNLPVDIEEFQGQGDGFAKSNLEQWQGQGNNFNKDYGILAEDPKIYNNEINEKINN